MTRPDVILPAQHARYPAMPDDDRWRQIDPLMRRKLATRWYRAQNQTDGPSDLPDWTPTASIAHRVRTRALLGLLVMYQRLGSLEADADRLRADAERGYSLARSCADMQRHTAELLEEFGDAATEPLDMRAGQEAAS